MWIMALILLSEYGERHKKSKTAVTKMACRGSFQTAKKVGRQWFIEEDEPYPDNRIKDGRYIGRRKKLGSDSSKKDTDK